MENFTYNRDTFPRNRLAKIINRIRIIEENATRKTTKMELEHTTIKVVFVNSQLNYIKPNIQANYKKGISWSYPGGNQMHWSMQYLLIRALSLAWPRRRNFFNVYYREFPGGVSGLKDLNSQKERLERQISHWKTLYT